jgi:tripartite-type tricarboxylate transporter receptor subunit TctC
VNREFSVALTGGAVKERLEALSAQPLGMTPAQFAAFYANESRKRGGVARKAGLQPQ